MKSVTTSQKILALALLSLGASGVLYWLVERAVDTKTAAFIEVRDARVRELFEAQNVQRAQDLLDVTFGTRALLEGYLLPVDEPLEFLALVDDTIPRIAGAPTNVVSISKETPDEKKTDETEKPPHVRVVLNAQGDWNNLFHLLLLLEHMPYAVSLDRAVMTLSTTESEYAWEADLFLTGGAQ